MITSQPRSSVSSITTKRLSKSNTKLQTFESVELWAEFRTHTPKQEIPSMHALTELGATVDFSSKRDFGNIYADVLFQGCKKAPTLSVWKVFEQSFPRAFDTPSYLSNFVCKTKKWPVPHGSNMVSIFFWVSCCLNTYRCWRFRPASKHNRHSESALGRVGCVKS